MENQKSSSSTLKLFMIAIATTVAAMVLTTYALGTDTITPRATSSPPPTLTPEAHRLYDPAQYGIPDTLGGYKVLAILTPQDVACMGSRSKRIVLQTTEPNVHEYLESPKSIREILEYLRQIPGEEETNWQIAVVGPGATLESISSNIISWNDTFTDKPCRRLGGPQITLTPSS